MTADSTALYRLSVWGIFEATERGDVMTIFIHPVNGGRELCRSTKRFAGCSTTTEMKSRLLPGETIGKYTYAGGTQIEVRSINACGREIIVATARLKSETKIELGWIQEESADETT